MSQKRIHPQRRLRQEVALWGPTNETRRRVPQPNRYRDMLGSHRCVLRRGWRGTEITALRAIDPPSAGVEPDLR
jgi:hypothetical protein